MRASARATATAARLAEDDPTWPVHGWLIWMQGLLLWIMAKDFAGAIERYDEALAFAERSGDRDREQGAEDAGELGAGQHRDHRDGGRQLDGVLVEDRLYDPVLDLLIEYEQGEPDQQRAREAVQRRDHRDQQPADAIERRELGNAPQDHERTGSGGEAVPRLFQHFLHHARARVADE